jgi:hypothetical protein
MGLSIDPAISKKVRKMRSRVRWQAPMIATQGIDQTRLGIADGLASPSAFSFLVIGDSGFGPQSFGHPQQEVADYLATQMSDCRFLLHTGDVVYRMGSPDQYPTKFIAPYRDWLVGGDRSERLDYRQLIFRKPFLPVPGNHDYYNLPFPYGHVVAALQPLRRSLNLPLPPTNGRRGSATGDTYARAFLDYLKDVSPARLAQHLEQHYTTPTETGRALTYEPGQFTRLPNRYYQFRYGNIDFFALDSSTFNRPVDVDGAETLTAESPGPQLPADLDWAQLFWLRDRLIASHQNPNVRGRVLYLHHPPYITEANKRYESACQTVRQHLRWVLDAVAERIADDAAAPLLDLVLSGHAHCFEYLRTGETGHGDRHLNWLVCGGSGARLRSQHADTTICEPLNGTPQVVAKSQLFIGRHGHGTDTHWPYTFVRIDVERERESDRPQFVVRPFIAQNAYHTWTRSEFTPLML